MAIYTIETPDGRKVTIEADSEEAAVAGAEEFVKDNPKQEQSVAMDVGLQTGAGLNRGLDASLNFISAPFRGAMNVVGRGLGLGEIEPLELFSRANVVTPEDATSTAGRYAGTMSEAVGGSVLPSGAMLQAGKVMGSAAPGILKQFATSPKRALTYDAIGASGAGAGIQLARDKNLGTAGEVGLGFAGGILAPTGYAAAARTGDVLKSAARYGNRAVRAAKNPEAAAYDTVADWLVEAKVPADDLRAAISPEMSADLKARGLSDADMADIISRRLRGETAASIGKDYGITPATVNKYKSDYEAANPTPMNIADLAVEMQGPGGAMPVLRRARAAFGIADDAADSAKQLYDRQTEQSGRVGGIVKRSGGRNADLEAEVERLRGVAKQEERDAYTTAHQHRAPVIIDSVVSNWRNRAFRRSGEIGRKLSEAIDLFFVPELREPRQSPAAWLRITEARERLQKAIAEGQPAEEIAKLRRRALVAREQDMFNRNPQLAKVGKTVQDVQRFVDSRQALDHMIQTSFHEGKPTPLTQVLSDFRTELNNAARSNNPALASADARFYGNRTAERIIERGSEMGKRLTPDTREAMRDFRTMTPNQQELFRVAFEQRLADDAFNVRDTGGAANQFSTKAFREIVNAFYPPVSSAARGPDRAAQQAIFQRGQELLRNLNREAISTATGSFITGRANSPTAPWMNDIASQMQNARVAADVATGRFGRALEWLSDRLAKQIGQGAAREQLKILTETDPATLLQILNRLELSAQNSAQRRALVTELREMRRPQMRAAPMSGASLLLGQ